VGLSPTREGKVDAGAKSPRRAYRVVISPRAFQPAPSLTDKGPNPGNVLGPSSSLGRAVEDGYLETHAGGRLESTGRRAETRGASEAVNPRARKC